MTAVINRAATVRTATSADREGIIAMHARCSPVSRYKRWHGGRADIPHAYLDEALCGTSAHFGYVATAPDGAVIGFGSGRLTDADTREIGLLVEDGWQRHGIGGAMLSLLADQMRAAGERFLVADLLGDDIWMVGVLQRFGNCVVAEESGELNVVVTLGD